jgi:hypothetical protein
MALDSDLLGQARAAQARVIDTERDADVARAEFHRAVRRLQLAGGSLREIAQALGLSHQRVHQIVEATGGSRSWRRGRAGSGELLSCSFCGKHQKQVKKLIAGPNVYICDGCIDRVHAVLVASGKTARTPIATIEQVSDENREDRCSFCGKSRRQVEAMAAAAGLPLPGVKGSKSGAPRICNECLDMCDEIVSDGLD